MHDTLAQQKALSLRTVLSTVWHRAQGLLRIIDYNRSIGRDRAYNTSLAVNQRQVD